MFTEHDLIREGLHLPKKATCIETSTEMLCSRITSASPEKTMDGQNLQRQWIHHSAWWQINDNIPNYLPQKHFDRKSNISEELHWHWASFLNTIAPLHVATAVSSVCMFLFLSVVQLWCWQLLIGDNCRKYLEEGNNQLLILRGLIGYLKWDWFPELESNPVKICLILIIGSYTLNMI